MPTGERFWKINYKADSVRARGAAQTLCTLCGGKAMYHAGGLGYCEGHKAEATEQHRKTRDKWVNKVSKRLALLAQDSDFIDTVEDYVSR